MFTMLILAALACLWLFFGKKRDNPATGTEPAFPQGPAPDEQPEKDLPAGDQGYYRIVNRTKRTPRKTYLFGFLRGKYWGEVVVNEDRHDDALFYDFHIYEAEVQLELSYACSCINPDKPDCSGLHQKAEGKFEGRDESFFSREKLPGQLPVIVKKDGKEYAVTLYEPRLADVRLLSRMHQTGDKEVSGTIEGYITGILLDFTAETYAEQLYFKDISAGNVAPLPAMPPFPQIKMPARAIHSIRDMN